MYKRWIYGRLYKHMKEETHTRTPDEQYRLRNVLVKRAKQQLRLHGHSLFSSTVDTIRWGELGIRLTASEDRELMKEALEFAKRDIRNDK